MAYSLLLRYKYQHDVDWVRLRSSSRVGRSPIWAKSRGGLCYIKEFFIDDAQLNRSPCESISQHDVKIKALWAENKR